MASFSARRLWTRKKESFRVTTTRSQPLLLFNTSLAPTISVSGVLWGPLGIRLTHSVCRQGPSGGVGADDCRFRSLPNRPINGLLHIKDFSKSHYTAFADPKSETVWTQGQDRSGDPSFLPFRRKYFTVILQMESPLTRLIYLLCVFVDHVLSVSYLRSTKGKVGGRTIIRRSSTETSRC